MTVALSRVASPGSGLRLIGQRLIPVFEGTGSAETSDAPCVLAWCSCWATETAPSRFLLQEAAHAVELRHGGRRSPWSLLSEGTRSARRRPISIREVGIQIHT